MTEVKNDVAACYRMPGEFEPHSGTLLVWPVRPGSWGHGALAAKKAFCHVMEESIKSERVWLLVDEDHAEEARAMAPEGTELLTIATDDAWARDIGPTFVVKKPAADTGDSACTAAEGDAKPAAEADAGNLGKEQDACESDLPPVVGIDWEFNAWGGDVDGLYAHWDRDDRAAAAFLESIGVPRMDAHPFILEGGSIHSDGEGTILTTESCLLSAGRNAGMTKEEIEKTLCHYLGGKKVIWLPRGIYNDETNEHVDNVCAFVRPGEVALAWTEDENDPQYPLSKACLDLLESETDAMGRSFKVYKLPIPKEPITVSEEDLAGYTFEEGEDMRDVGERLAASYVNFYITNDAVLVPAFGDPSDDVSAKILGEAFPARRICQIPARDILLGGGNIHCITQQIPQGI